MLINCHHFEARQRPESPECSRYLNPAVWLEVCRAHTKACRQVLARTNSRTKRNNLVKIMPWMIYKNITLSQKNHYKMSLIASKKAESLKKAQGELGTLTGVYVNSVYFWPRWHQSTWLFPLPPSNLASGVAIKAALQ